MIKNTFILLLLALPLFSAQAGTHVNVGGVDVAVWEPSTPAPLSGYPLIVFSHGFGGCNTQSVFLMEALAQAGYVVVAPNHKDARCGNAHDAGEAWYPGKVLRETQARQPEEPFQNHELWTDSTYRDRQIDIKNLLDAILKPDSLIGVRIDSQRIGIAGHSLGGYTALGVAGAWPTWKDKRIKAVAALSPYSSPFVDNGNLSGMRVPVMYQGGSRDFGITPMVRRQSGAYDRSSAPKIYIEFDGAGHFAWTNINKKYQSVIDTYTIAFFDRYLKGQKDPDPLAPLLAKQGKDISYLRVER